MNKIVFFVVLGVVLLLPTHIFAGPIVRTGEVVSVDASQTTKGDFYGLASKVIISGVGEDDAFLMGGTVTVNAPVLKDLTIAGGAVQVHGDVGDDLRVIGGDVIIGKVVKGDVVIVGGSLTILSTASVEGDILFYGGNLTIEGPVLGAIHGSAEEVRINAEVGGDISMDIASTFVLGSNAKTMGNITYESPVEFVRAQDAVITNDPHRVDVQGVEKKEIFAPYVFTFFLMLFATLILFVVLRKPVRAIVNIAATRFGFSGLVGLGIVLTVPFVSIILMVSVLGVLAGVLLLLSYTLLICGALILSPITLGYVINVYVFKKDSMVFSTVLIGVVCWILVCALPVVGAPLLIVCVMVTLGACGIALYERLRA